MAKRKKPATLKTRLKTVRVFPGRCESKELCRYGRRATLVDFAGLTLLLLMMIGAIVWKVLHG